MARSVSHLAPFLQVSTRAADALRAALGTFSTRTYRHASDEALADLRRRIAATKWPSRELVLDVSQGVQLATISELACYW